jgi:DNA repair exonuclease SbcCD nuclease subunit
VRFAVVRLLLVADTHLGFDLPFRPRVARRRRGRDFFANFGRALEPALRQEVDLVVHGGDLLFRSRVPEALVEMAMAPLVKVAQTGVPVLIVPGNHERSRIPLHLWTLHSNIHIFDEPKTFLLRIGGVDIALSGFPFRRRARDSFGQLVVDTGYRQVSAAIHLLCIHQTVEGAQVGVQNYTFRRGPDVVRGREIPGQFAAVLCGHIHRSQILTHDLGGQALAAPVVYPGAVERTSFAERSEEKHFVIASFAPTEDGRGELVRATFVPLPSRPMESVSVEPSALSSQALITQLRNQLRAMDGDAVVRIQVRGPVSTEASRILSAPSIRSLAPASMNVTVSYHSTARLVD